MEETNDPAAMRLDFDALAPRFSAAMNRLDAAAGEGLDARLRELVRLHASVINGCAYCVDMHSKDARAAGETEQRLYSLGAWREAPWFTPAERAALALTEAVTLVHRDHVPAGVVDEAARHFEPQALAQLIALVVTINAWNRIGVTTRCWEPGSYQVGS
jgi:AhpD family alkylhydroperoxidase